MTRNALRSNQMRLQADLLLHTLLKGNKLSNGNGILLNETPSLLFNDLLINLINPRNNSEQVFYDIYPGARQPLFPSMFAAFLISKIQNQTDCHADIW